MTPATQALQREDSANPAMLWVQGGQQRFEAGCKGCHAAQALRGVATRYPAFDTVLGKPVTFSNVEPEDFKLSLTGHGMPAEPTRPHRVEDPFNPMFDFAWSEIAFCAVERLLPTNSVCPSTTICGV